MGSLNNTKPISSYFTKSNAVTSVTSSVQKEQHESPSISAIDNQNRSESTGSSTASLVNETLSFGTIAKNILLDNSSKANSSNSHQDIESQHMLNEECENRKFELDLIDHLSDSDFEESRKKCGDRIRSINQSWFSQFIWLRYSRTLKKVFCIWCIDSNKSHVHLGKAYEESAFITDGFDNWKKAVQKFKDHASSRCHLASKEHMASKLSASIDQKLKQQLSQQREIHRKGLLIHLLALRYLLRQGLPLFKGKDPENSNIIQTIKLLADSGNEDAKNVYSGKEYICSDVTSELSNLFGRQILLNIIDRFYSECLIDLYSVLADETRDCSGNEQLNVSIRWVDKSFIVHEDILRLYSFEGIGQTGEKLAIVILDVLLRINLPLEKIRGQGYDGAASMAGESKGVAMRIKQRAPNAHYVHCLAHCLNLAVSDATNSSKILTNSIDIVHQITTFIRNSTVQKDIFNNKLFELNDGPTLSLRPLCPTRWTVRAESIRSVLVNFQAILNSLEEIKNIGSPDQKTTATGLLSLIKSAEFYFSIYISYKLFSVTDSLSTSIQNVNVNITEVLQASVRVVQDIESLRNNFDKIFEETELKVQSFELEEFALPRQRKMPKRYDDSSATDFNFSTPKDYYRRLYFESIDCILQSISDRLSPNLLKPAQVIEQVIVKSLNGENIEEELLVSLSQYHSNIDPKSLLLDLTPIPPCDPKTISGLVNWFREDLSIRSLTHHSLYEAIATLFVMPTTTATCERSLSCLRRLKTYLRSTFGQTRLNTSILADSYPEIIDKISLTEMAREFVTIRPDRLHHFGKFS